MFMVKNIFKALLCIVLVIIILAAGLLGYFTITEYAPDDEVVLNIYGKDSFEGGSKLKAGYAFNIMSWNIGFGAFGDNAENYFYGGTSVFSSDEERINSNLANIISQIKYQHPNIVLLQEVDTNSDRTYNLDEAKRIASNLDGKLYTFAKDHNVPFIPYPWPPLGRVESGLLTLSDYKISEATRGQLPIPHGWPMRIFRMKHCIAVHRIPVENSDKELVLVNVHLESYLDDAGMEEQARILDSIMESEIANGNYVIVGGDFNMTFPDVDISKYPIVDANNWVSNVMTEGTFDASWQLLMDDSVPSCRYLNKVYAGANHEPDQFQYYVIDGFIVSSNIEVVKCETKDLGFVYSDHNPVFMRVKLLK